MALLLDTCAALWLVEDQPVRRDVARVVDEAGAYGAPGFLSPVTAWEIGTLVSRGRLSLPTDPSSWFDYLLRATGLRLAKITPKILVASSNLPGRPPKDPAARIFAATAREFGGPLVTLDRLLLEYAAEGHIQALAC